MAQSARLAAALVYCVLCSAAAAQTSGTLKPDQKKPTIDDSAILPEAGEAGQSAAPTMATDCQQRPGECIHPETPSPEKTPELSK